ncbi:MAG TPA: TlpA disulfide reductase family protein [Myxococcota bacterium]|nr:TlpA disulfide reductase family protein [Myxococcota bacterium]
MSAVALGPLALPLGALLLLIAFGTAAAAGRFAGREANTGIVSALADMLIVGVVVARLAFVVRWLDLYRDAPWSALDVRDGGFEPWAGVGAALLVAAWQGSRRAPLRVPLAAGIAAGALAWAAGFGALRLLDPPEGRLLPARSLATLEGESTTLAALAEGRPLVLNLWATWCPPCRREMPALAAAQRSRPGAAFVFANQGEGPEPIRRYLDAAGLELANVLLDPDAALGRDTRSAGLPTTLFYDGEGHLVDVHMGALSSASLAAKLARLGGDAAGAQRR